MMLNAEIDLAIVICIAPCILALQHIVLICQIMAPVSVLLSQLDDPASSEYRGTIPPLRVNCEESRRTH